MKRITLELSDDAFRHLRTMRDLAGITDNGSPLAPVIDRIIRDIEAGTEVCSLKTRQEREVEQG